MNKLDFIRFTIKKCIVHENVFVKTTSLFNIIKHKVES